MSQQVYHITLEQFERHPAYTNWIDAHPARVWGRDAPDRCWPAAKRDRIRTHAQLIALQTAHPDLENLTVNLPTTRFPARLKPRLLFARAGCEIKKIRTRAAAPLIWCLQDSSRYGWHFHIVAPSTAKIRAAHRIPVHSTGDDLSALAQYFCDPIDPVFKNDVRSPWSDPSRNAPPRIGSLRWLARVEGVCAQMASDALEHPGSRLPPSRGVVGFSKTLQAAVKEYSRALTAGIYAPVLVPLPAPYLSDVFASLQHPA